MIHIKNNWIKRISLIGLGALMTLTFAPYYYNFLLPIIFSLLFYTINKNIPKRKLFGTGFWFGMGLGAFSTAWIANALMIDGGMYVSLIPVVWIGMGILFGLFWGIPTCLSGFYKVGLHRLLGWAALITLFEWIRSWFLTGFPWNLTGSVWEDTLPILQFASIFGVYGLTFITLVLCSIPVFWSNKKIIGFALFLFTLIYGFGFYRVYNGHEAVATGIRLRLVQPNIPQTLKWDPDKSEENFVKILRLSKQNNQSITHTLWPESAVSFIVNQDKTETPRLMQAVRQGGTLIMGGIRTTGVPETPLANSLFVLDDFANILAHYDKTHLVPFGEYIPFRQIIPLDKLVPIPFDFKEGKELKTIRVAGTPPFGSLVCYEIIFSGHVVSSKERPSWLVNTTNDGWYGLSAGPYQHLGMAKMRAVEEGLPIARVANTGISAVFDGYGQTIGKLPLGTEGVLDTTLPMPLPKTIYSRFGYWLPIGILTILLLFLYLKRK